MSAFTSSGSPVTIYGNPWLSPCSEAAVNFSVAYSTQIVSRWKADGLMLDNNIYEAGAHGPVDYCDACQARFSEYVAQRFGDHARSFFGVAASKVTIPRSHTSPLHPLWVRWRNRVWAEEINTFRRQFSPLGVAVSANILYLSNAWTYGSGEAPRFQDLVISESRQMTPGYLSDKASFSLTAAASAQHPLFDYVGLIDESVGRVATCIDQKLLAPAVLRAELTSSWMHGPRPCKGPRIAFSFHSLPPNSRTCTFCCRRGILGWAHPRGLKPNSQPVDRAQLGIVGGIRGPVPMVREEQG